MAEDIERLGTELRHEGRMRRLLIADLLWNADHPVLVDFFQERAVGTLDIDFRSPDGDNTPVTAQRPFPRSATCSLLGLPRVCHKHLVSLVELLGSSIPVGQLSLPATFSAYVLEDQSPHQPPILKLLLGNLADRERCSLIGCDELPF